MKAIKINQRSSFTTTSIEAYNHTFVEILCCIACLELVWFCELQKSGRAQVGDGQQGERLPECKQQ